MWNPVIPLEWTTQTPSGPIDYAAHPHDHVDCRPNQRPWLETKVDQAATMRRHSYCVICGKIKNLDGPQARALGFYLSGLSALKEHLQRSAHFPKMTQSQSRLITRSLEDIREFEDQYGMSLEAQAHAYVAAVRGVRHDLDDELIIQLLPRRRRARSDASP